MIEKQSNWKSYAINSSDFFFPKFCEKIINRFILKNSSKVRVELATLISSMNSDLIYSIYGPLAFPRLYSKNTKVVPWVFSPPQSTPKSILNPYCKINLQRNSGFLCLTPTAEKYFSQFAPAKFIPWCVDMELFDGINSDESADRPFFLASGKTGRDYKTLVNAALETKAEIRIIGPKNQKPSSCPENVNWIETSIDPPDQAIDYPTLKKWYAQCSGVCIPLSGDANDTCGYTNMLEGMAMAKPVLMTRSGCLHIDPETHDFGLLIEPQDSKGWSDSMNKIINDPATANKFGEKGRKIAEYEFNIDRFNNDVISFINKILEN